MDKGYTLSELMIALTIISFALTVIVQFIIFYNQLVRQVENINRTITEAKLLSSRIQNVLNKKPNEKIVFINSDNNIIIKRQTIDNSLTLSAIGLYKNSDNVTNNHYFVNNNLRIYKIPSTIQVEYNTINYNGVRYVNLVVYGEIKLSNKPKKTQFAFFMFNI